jgi:hypothetical protein
MLRLPGQESAKRNSWRLGGLLETIMRSGGSRDYRVLWNRFSLVHTVLDIWSKDSHWEDRCRFDEGMELRLQAARKL